MTRRRPNQTPHFDPAAEVIRIEADNLARHHGIDAYRVRRIMKRTATDAEGQPIQAAVRGQDNLENGLQFRPSLEEALAYLPPDAALRVFELTEPTTLAKRSELVRYLADPISPSNTIAELASYLESFHAHLVQNREALLHTGYPRSQFELSPWLEWHLTLLSPTKVPIVASSFAGLPRAEESAVLDQPECLPGFNDIPGSSPTNALHQSHYRFSWTRNPLPPLWSRDGPFLMRQLEQDITPDFCSYDEAAHIHGLTPGRAQQLEDGRLRFFELKTNAILSCARCLDSRDVETVWPSFLEILVDSVMWHEMECYLDVEDIYWQVGIGECVVPAFRMRTPHEVPGTLSTLLTVVGHVEKELRFRTFDRTVTSIKRLLGGAGIDSIGSYFTLVGHPDQDAFDTALDQFAALESREQTFWEEYRRRVNSALESELREEVVVRIPVRRRHRRKFEPYLKTFADWQLAHIEATGDIARMQLSSLAPREPFLHNRFQLHGHMWTIEFGGEVVHCRDSRGMRYLAILLAHPNHEFHVMDLYRRVSATPNGGSAAYSVIGSQDLEGTDRGNPGLGDVGDVIDQEACNALLQRLREIPSEIDEKVALGDSDGADHLRSDQEQITRYLAAAIGLGGTPRKGPSASERARTSVTKRIKDARKQIAAHHSSLGMHLRSVTTGTYCEYAPDSPIEWKVSGPKGQVQ